MLLAVLLTLHSWSRWAVVVSALAVVATSTRGWLTKAPWAGLDRSLACLWVGAVDVQITLGFLLYFIASPMAEIARQNMRGAWADETIRFFGILHPLAMLLVGATTHAVWIAARRTDDPRQRFARLSIGVIATLALLAIAIPWPFLPWGRPLVRF